MATRYRIHISKRAGADLQRIFDGIATNSRQNASNVLRRIMASIDGLKDVPHRTIVSGQQSQARPVRSLPEQSWMIFFEVHHDHHEVRILRIRHGSRRQLKRYK